MNIKELLDEDLLKHCIQEKYVYVKIHKKTGYKIYNYTRKTTYDSYWNDITKTCRGLITNKDGEIISRPFKKFFNCEEFKKPIPNEPFEVTEKVDGSLGITYFIDDVAYIATRGSFSSNQALKGSSLLLAKQINFKFKLNPKFTYLFEIIYPENKIVVDYGNRQDLVLLAVIDTNTGTELNLDDYNIGFTPVKKYKFNSIGEMYNYPHQENKEGFVVRFKSGLRLKVKFEEYCFVHKILSTLSEKTVWDGLKDGKSFDYLSIPAEYLKWIEEKKIIFETKFKQIEFICRDITNKTKGLSEKDAALYILGECQQINKFYAAICFAMSKNKEYKDNIWKLLQPKNSKPFFLNRVEQDV